MRALIADRSSVHNADPSIWAPFVLVGEGSQALATLCGWLMAVTFCRDVRVGYRHAVPKWTSLLMDWTYKYTP